MFGLQRGRYIFSQIITWEPSTYTVDIVCNFMEGWKIPLVVKRFIYLKNKTKKKTKKNKFNLYFAYSWCCQTYYSLSTSSKFDGLNSFHSGYQ